MNVEDLTIKEARELAQMFGKCTSQAPVNHGLQIVVADRGFVYIGEVTTDADWVYVHDASNIRIWGTSKGLGELVGGPTSKTALDKTGNLKISRKALISLIEVEASKWTGKY